MIFLLDAESPDAPFPPVEQAETEPNGLLAVGGDLSPARLLNAYRAGIFPWYSPGQPILWWSPNPRAVLFPGNLRLNRSLRKAIRNRGFQVSFDQAFGAVMRACAAPRDGADGTWITAQMLAAYETLHQLGRAHSVEVWHDGELAGGLYGVHLGRVFFGESMFSLRRDASKVALAYLSDFALARGLRLIDCQVYSDHLLSLGAEEIPRSRFNAMLGDWCEPPLDIPWDRPPRAELGPLAAAVHGND